MTMTPINRIPKEEFSLEQIVSAEMGNRSLPEVFLELHTHSKGNAEHISCCMDWAMEIRDRMGIEWGNAIDVAMTLYFG